MWSCISSGRRVGAALAAISLALTACSGGDSGESDVAATGSGTATDSEPATDGDVQTGASDPYTLGCLTDLGGPYVGFGQPQAAGFTTYIDSVNAEGGVHGREIQTDVRDERSEVERGVSEWRTMSGTDGMLGVFCITLSSIWSAIGDDAEADQVSQISTGAVDEFTDPAQPYLFKTAPTGAQSAGMAANWLADWASENGVETPQVAFIAPDTPAQQGVLQAMEALAGSSDFEVVSSDFYPPGSTDLASVSAAVAQEDPDVVVANSFGTDMAPVHQALRDRNFTGPIVNLTTGAANAESLYQQLQDPNYFAFRDFADPTSEALLETSDAANEMVERAEASGTDDQLTSRAFTLGYLQAWVAVEALKACDPGCSSEAFMKSLESVSIPDTGGLSGPIEMSANDHVMAETGQLWAYDADSGRSEPVTDWVGGDQD